MISTRPIFIIFLAFSLWSGKAYSQIGISNEIGVIAGPAGFFTDYGERYSLRNNLENRGFGVGLVHYMNFAFKPFCSCKADDWWFSEHFRIRNEIDYMRSELNHYGPVSSKNDLGGRQLRAMKGTTQLIQAGTSLEYHFYGIKEARDFGVTFAPYISLGVHYVYYNPYAYSEIGDINNPKILFPTFQGGLDLEEGTTFAILGSAGVRYRVGRSNDILIESRWHYYDSDYIEGLDVQGPQNKFNDFVFWLNVGYVYYIDF